MEKKTQQRAFALVIIFIMAGSSIAFAVNLAVGIPHTSQQPTSAEQQNLTLVLLEYGCDDCPDVVNELQALATAYSPYVDVQRGGTALISMTSVINSTKLETLDRKSIEDFICDTFLAYRLRHDECLFRAI